MDRTCLRRWVNCAKESYFLQFMYVDVARQLVGIAHFYTSGNLGTIFDSKGFGIIWRDSKKQGGPPRKKDVKVILTEDNIPGARIPCRMQNCPIEKIVTMRGKERLGEIKGIGHMVGPLVRSLRCTCAKLQNTGSLFCISSKKHQKVNYFILSIFVGFKITLRMDYMLHIFVIQMDE